MKQGGISTHVLDVSTGLPAAGVHVTLSHGQVVVASATTDSDGRIESLATDLERGSYSLLFDLGGYFGERAHLFLSVAVDVLIEDPGRHHHVPLLVSPYSFSSYRGS
jgi:5-hydroxyisourate hydrolase